MSEQAPDSISGKHNIQFKEGHFTFALSKCLSDLGYWIEGVCDTDQPPNNPDFTCTIDGVETDVQFKSVSVMDKTVVVKLYASNSSIQGMFTVKVTSGQIEVVAPR
jgi:hypothetical protein